MNDPAWLMSPREPFRIMVLHVRDIIFNKIQTRAIRDVQRSNLLPFPWSAGATLLLHRCPLYHPLCPGFGNATFTCTCISSCSSTSMSMTDVDGFNCFFFALLGCGCSTTCASSCSSTSMSMNGIRFRRIVVFHKLTRRLHNVGKASSSTLVLCPFPNSSSLYTSRKDERTLNMRAACSDL